jgi:hypothetical protein
MALSVPPRGGEATLSDQELIENSAAIFSYEKAHRSVRNFSLRGAIASGDPCRIEPATASTGHQAMTLARSIPVNRSCPSAFQLVV